MIKFISVAEIFTIIFALVTSYVTYLMLSCPTYLMLRFLICKMGDNKF